MKAKTLIELLSLTSSIYMISKDKEFFERLEELTQKGKNKINHLMDEFSEQGENGEEKLLEKIIHKARQAKEELEHKIEDTATKVYRKMHITHTDDLKNVLQRLEIMEKKLNLVEAQIANFTPKNS